MKIKKCCINLYRIKIDSTSCKNTKIAKKNKDIYLIIKN